MRLLHSPIRGALGSHRRGAGHGGHASLHTSHDIGTGSLHWHTPHPTPTPLRAWGAQRGDCERVRPCIAPPITTEHRPHFPGHPKHTPSQSPSCYSSRKLSVRARGSHRCPLRAGTSRSRFQSYANPGIRRAEVRLSMHCSQSAARRPACSTAHGVRGRGALVGAAPSRTARVRSRLARLPVT